MSATRAGNGVTITGPPGNARGVVAFDVDVDEVESVMIALNIAGEASVYRGALRSVAGVGAELRVRLPETTAPGTYKGEATIGGKPRPIVVEIEARPRIRVRPAQTMLTLEPSSSKPFALTLSNGGNVSIDVPRTALFDLDDADGQDRALGRSLRATIQRGEQRIERFMEELRTSHGGEARVTIKSGAGPLRPGEVREIACVFEVPESARAGQSYTGSWNIGPASHEIVADMMTSSRPNKVQAAQ